jgi:mannose-1-phosphate guanylyltransferase/mannose-6-phosphate isomerase
MDYGLAEKVKKIAVIPVSMGWNDLGSWNSIYENGQKDKDGNLCHGKVFNLDTKDSLIWSEDNLIATVGLSNIIVIQTPDAILISDRNRSEEIKLLVENLRRSNPKVIEENVTIYRPWGTYQVLSENNNFKVKRIIVKPKSKLSLQMHQHRSEHWVVVSGTATIINNNNEKSTLKINESTYIPKKQKHRLMNDTNSDLIIIEVQCGEYVGEDDILRFDDFYGRKSNE